MEKLVDLFEKVLKLPSSQFWVFVFGLFFLSIVIFGAIGFLGLVFVVPMLGAAIALIAQRTLRCDKCDDDDYKDHTNV